MSVAKLAKGGLTMTDTCSPMLLFRKLWSKAVVEVAKAEGMEDNEIAIYTRLVSEIEINTGCIICVSQ